MVLTRHRVPALFAALLVVVQIGYPLTEGAVRDRVTVAVVLLAAAGALSHAAVTRGRRFAAGTLVIVSGVGLLAEAVGTTTGVPFGCYEYAVGRIGPELWSVPLIVPLAWVGGLYPVWVVAGMLSRRAVSWIGLTAVGAVGWDLFLDPQMVADGQWSWCSSESGLPGLAHIPVTNYLGWFAVGLVMAALLWWWDGVAARTAVPAPMWNDTTALPVAVFLWTWLGSILAHAVFLGLPTSAGYGAVGMGLLGVPLLVRLRRARYLCPGR
ncbi:carotenoid biosynthesis protein [Nocardia sp. NBC_01377]|uniref:carotenoid biosynthesis protein n=1 Tax=Nocardia sp. NBC_01377 TaxID=2903595 RepID=UPI0038668DDB